MLTITPATLEAIHAQGRASYPNECCGLLIGRFVGCSCEHRRIALEAWPVSNEWTADVALTADESEHSLRDRFYIPPQAYLQAQRSALRRDLEIVGCYHTHPDDRAWPSERDRVGAAGVGGGLDFSFVIVSILQGTPADVASALLSADGQQWLPEELTIEEA
jgi:proteasome lid subunit RPN8/RPN11